MKRAYFCGCFTIDANMRTAIREYSSSNFARVYFTRETEKKFGPVIHCLVAPIEVPQEGENEEEVLKFRRQHEELSNELYRDGMWTLRTFYPEEYSNIFGGV